MIDGVFAIGEDGQVHFAETAALRRKTAPRRSSRYALGCCACSPDPSGPANLQSRSKWRLFGLEFRLLNVANGRFLPTMTSSY